MDAMSSRTPARATAVWGAAGRDPQLGWAHVTWWRAFLMACGLADCREQQILGNNAVTCKAKAPTSPKGDVQLGAPTLPEERVLLETHTCCKGLGMFVFL